MLRDYSQLGEQAVILWWASMQERQGSFVDLGAYDGITYSNTAALADMGWPGICVDAAPDAAAACVDRYADRDDVAVIHAAFAADEGSGQVTLGWSPGAMYSTLSGHMHPASLPVAIHVPRLNREAFAAQVRDLPRPLFCSIDLEGNSLDALQWLLENAAPDCVCVEANNPGDRDKVRLMLQGWTEIPLPENHVNLLMVAP